MLQETIHRRSVLRAMASAGLASTLPACVHREKVAMQFFAHPERKIGLQTYTLGDEVAADIPAAFARIAAIGYEQLELPGLYGAEPAALADAARNAGLAITSVHLGVSTQGAATGLSLNSPTQEIVDTMGTLGAQRVVLPISLFPDEMSPREGESVQRMLGRSITEAGPDLWLRTAALLNERGTALRPHGIQLGYHNHNMEFAPTGDTTGWDILVAQTDPAAVDFEMDTGWVAAAGRDPAAEIARLGSRVRQLHVKDIAASTAPNFLLSMDPTEIGAGSLNWPAILAASAAAGVEHYYIEQEPPFTIPRFEAIARSHDFLAQVAAA